MPRLNVIFFNYTFFASVLTSNAMQTNTQTATARTALASGFQWYGTIGIEFAKLLANGNPLVKQQQQQQYELAKIAHIQAI